MNELHWPAPPPDLTLLDHEIHLWSFSLEQSPDSLSALAKLLSAEEQARSGRFYFERDRRRFIAAHGFLRRLLSRYLPTSPEQLRYVYGARGKPALSQTGGHRRLCFNLSHSGELALCGVAYDRELGVDIEKIRPLDDLDSLARHFFSAAEYEQLQALPDAQRSEAFYLCWTRKEAYLKAGGDGLARPLDQFSVSVHPGEPARFLSIAGSSAEAANWFLQTLAPGTGYAGAVVAPGRDWRVSCWSWSED